MRIRRDKPGLEPVRMATDMEIAWAAGVYEGEGAVLSGGSSKNSFAVSVAQKDPELLYRLRDLFGGSIGNYSNNRGNIASKNTPFTIYAWRLCGDKARIFLTAIYPFLTARRKSQIDATTAIHFIRFVGQLPGVDFVPYVQSRLEEWISIHRGNAREKRRRYLQQYHEQRKAEDPNYMENRRAATQAWREAQHQK